MAAGLGFKTFTTGEVLTAADTNGYLMQGVLVFADAAARTSAITSPQEGQMSYLKDTNSTEYYSGSAWVAVGGSTAPTFFAGKNKILNSDFSCWQRGTSFTTNGVYTADRWKMDWIGSTPTTWSVSQQTFTPGAAPVAGYEGQYYAQISVTTAGSTTAGYWYQRVEDVRTFAGQTVTYSFWAKADSARTITIYPYQSFPATDWTGTGQNVTLTTSWARYSVTFAMPSISGKTIGANSFMAALIEWSVASGASYQTWGHQMEAGSSATDFQTATGTIQGELAACQRYYFRTQTGTDAGYFGVTAAGSSTTTYANVIMKQTMRTTPTSLDFSGLKWQAINNSGNISAASISGATPENVLIVCTTTGATAGAMNFLAGQSNTAYVGFSAEL